jgi:hypothetical protein
MCRNDCWTGCMQSNSLFTAPYACSFSLIDIFYNAVLDPVQDAGFILGIASAANVGANGDQQVALYGPFLVPRIEDRSNLIMFHAHTLAHNAPSLAKCRQQTLLETVVDNLHIMTASTRPDLCDTRATMLVFRGDVSRNGMTKFKASSPSPGEIDSP